MNNYLENGFSLLAKIGFTWKEYDPNGVYERNDCVFNPEDGRSYIALIDNPSLPPVYDKENWGLISDRGKDGGDGLYRIKGEAEEEWSYKEYVITKAGLDLDHVENYSVEEIVQHIDKAWMDLDKVENYSLEDILQEVRQNVKPEELGGITKVTPERDVVYGAAENTGADITLPVTLDDEALGELFVKLTLAETPEEWNEILGEENGAILSTGAGLKLLMDLYKEWLEIRVIKDLHPVVGIKGTADAVYKTGYVELGLENFGLKIGDNGNIEAIMPSRAYHGVVETQSDVAIKEISVEDWVAGDNNMLYVTFKEGNEIAEMSFRINEDEPVPVYIQGSPVSPYNRMTFRKDGEYTFRYENGVFHFVSGSNKVVTARPVNLMADLWTGDQAPYKYWVSLPELKGGEMLDVQFDYENGTDEQKQALVECGLESTGVQTDTGFMLQCYYRPSINVPLIVYID